jgi:GNAT superfamily N-acetyltransferase
MSWWPVVDRRRIHTIDRFGTYDGAADVVAPDGAARSASGSVTVGPAQPPARPGNVRRVADERRRLRNGTTILVRPVRAEDAEALNDAFGRLSEDSRRRRFLSPKGRLTGGELRYLTDIDHHHHEALVAMTPDESELLGVARFIKLDDEPGAAEAAITVADVWQRRGVGSAMLESLRARAREEGVTTFVTEVLPENEQRIRALFGQVGELSDRRGVLPVRMRFALAPDADGHDPTAALRAAAAGALRVVTSAMPTALRRRP